jgi:hypothetical protein
MVPLVPVTVIVEFPTAAFDETAKETLADWLGPIDIGLGGDTVTPAGSVGNVRMTFELNPSSAVRLIWSPIKPPCATASEDVVNASWKSPGFGGLLLEEAPLPPPQEYKTAARNKPGRVIHRLGIERPSKDMI